MKIILIRHGKPNIEEPASCTGAEFEAWIEASQDSSPADVQPMNFDKGKYKLYSSDARITWSEPAPPSAGITADAARRTASSPIRVAK